VGSRRAVADEVCAEEALREQWADVHDRTVASDLVYRAVYSMATEPMIGFLCTAISEAAWPNRIGIPIEMVPMSPHAFGAPPESWWRT